MGPHLRCSLVFSFSQSGHHNFKTQPEIKEDHEEEPTMLNRLVEDVLVEGRMTLQDKKSSQNLVRLVYSVYSRQCGLNNGSI